jgi:hypothetical protein
MKTKMDAAKVLVQQGWSEADIEYVLNDLNSKFEFYRSSSHPSKYETSGYFDGHLRQGQGER